MCAMIHYLKYTQETEQCYEILVFFHHGYNNHVGKIINPYMNSNPSYFYFNSSSYDQNENIICKFCGQILLTQEQQNFITNMLKLSSLECVFKYLKTTLK